MFPYLPTNVSVVLSLVSLLCFGGDGGAATWRLQLMHVFGVGGWLGNAGQGRQAHSQPGRPWLRLEAVAQHIAYGCMPVVSMACRPFPHWHALVVTTYARNQPQYLTC